jgi:transglycosylase-like protein
MRTTRIVPTATLAVASVFSLSLWGALVAPRPATLHPSAVRPLAPVAADVDAFHGDYRTIPAVALVPTPAQPVASMPTTSVPVVAHPAEPRPRSRVRATAGTTNTAAGTGGTWACLRQHESGGNYAEDTGNGYYGAYQFSLSTWRAMGGTGLPSDASPAEQDALAQRLQQRAGWGQWPNTSRMCGV